MTDPMMTARAEAIQEIAGAMLKAAGDALLRHGADPHGHIILTAATAMFVTKTTEVIPHFRWHVAAMLTSKD